MTEPKKWLTHRRANHQVLSFLQETGRCTGATLADRFIDGPDEDRKLRDTLFKKLYWMAKTGQLVRTGFGREAIYTLGPMAFKQRPDARPIRVPLMEATPDEHEPAAAAPAPIVRAHLHSTAGTTYEPPKGLYYRNGGHAHLPSGGMRR